MTRPDDEPGDGDEPAEEAGNPFDLGLPMVRMPARRPPRRRRGGRRLPRRQRPDIVEPERVTPADILRTHDAEHRPGSVSIRPHEGGWDPTDADVPYEVSPAPGGSATPEPVAGSETDAPEPAFVPDRWPGDARHGESFDRSTEAPHEHAGQYSVAGRPAALSTNGSESWHEDPAADAVSRSVGDGSGQDDPVAGRSAGPAADGHSSWHGDPVGRSVADRFGAVDSETGSVRADSAAEGSVVGPDESLDGRYGDSTSDPVSRDMTDAQADRYSDDTAAPQYPADDDSSPESVNGFSGHRYGEAVGVGPDDGTEYPEHASAQGYSIEDSDSGRGDAAGWAGHEFPDSGYEGYSDVTSDASPNGDRPHGWAAEYPAEDDYGSPATEDAAEAWPGPEFVDGGPQHNYPLTEPGQGYTADSQHGYPENDSRRGYLPEQVHGYSRAESGEWAESADDEDDERSGEWEQWLDVSVPRAEPRQLAAHVPVRGYESDEYEDEDHVVAPSLVDRSGGNAGVRLRHPRRADRNSERSSGDKPMAMLIMLGLAIVVVAVLLTVIHTARNRTPSTVTAPSARVPVVAGTGAAGTSTAAAPAGAIAAEGCEQRHSADVTSGTDPGGTGSGPDAIFAFERAYYVQRSGFAARAVVADDAGVPPADQIQRGIDQMPSGTRYCVQITRAGDAADTGQWEVRLTQQKPGEQPRTFTQIITTRTAGARTLITTIAGA
ncbi:hypothetical protein [Nocardia aurantia]|uniref:DUF8176 domain-containing protein n=1 Tax=Nocardia aurantia TaxID=2585199 RepID=A0A7K0DIE6_9NOCA|nr:hypothetical protein [Nocardia aurantia]MQY25072.1 hypothetical protein [Nocardia aurantia]